MHVRHQLIFYICAYGKITSVFKQLQLIFQLVRKIIMFFIVYKIIKINGKLVSKGINVNKLLIILKWIVSSII